ncbi:unnamed protein product [Dovyalis caffra]|uniref:Uncharacterized protein n=1 Tax=Dovyalis caffra TaxID=77055 RepID=A0AAV1RSL1_9ROSI|nr:unnamed protein product [Dovyalis caffra]
MDALTIGSALISQSSLSEANHIAKEHPREISCLRPTALTGVPISNSNDQITTPARFLIMQKAAMKWFRTYVHEGNIAGLLFKSFQLYEMLNAGITCISYFLRYHWQNALEGANVHREKY